MAVVDNANGFWPVGNVLRSRVYTAEATIARGDMLAFDNASSGKVEVYAAGTHTDAIGVALSSAAADGDVVVADHPSQVFAGQCSGTPTAAMLGTAVDIEGTTGIQEINENATATSTVALRAVHNGGRTFGSESVLGTANSRLEFVIALHALAAS